MSQRIRTWLSGFMWGFNLIASVVLATLAYQDYVPDDNYLADYRALTQQIASGAQPLTLADLSLDGGQ